MLTATLDQMARGGIYDQLGGGFHRYATDREWKIPHFEKMLYDNGFLLELYAREHARTGDPQAARIVPRDGGLAGPRDDLARGGVLERHRRRDAGPRGGLLRLDAGGAEAALGEEDVAFLAPHPGLRRPAVLRGQPLRAPPPRAARGGGASGADAARRS